MRRTAIVMLLGLPAIVAAGLVTMQQFGARAGEAVATLRQRPVAVVVDEQTGRAFVASPATASNGGLIYVLDMKAGFLIRSVSLGSGVPVAMALDRRAGRLVVIDDAASDNVQILDAMTGSVLQHASAGIAPIALAVDERTGRAFIVDRGSDSVSVLDTRSGRLLGTTNVGFSPAQVAVDERTNRAFVATNGEGGDGQLCVFDATTGQLLRATPVRQAPGALSGAMALDQRHGRLFVAGTQTVSMFDAQSGRLAYTTQVGIAPLAVTVDDGTGRVIVGLSQGGGIRVLDGRTGRILRAVPIAPPGAILALLAAATGDRAVVVDPTTGALDLLDAWRGTLLGRMRVGPLSAQDLMAPGQMSPVAVDAHAGRIYVVVGGLQDLATATSIPGRPSVTGPGHVLTFDAHSGSILASPAVGVTPISVAIDEQAHRLLLLDEGGQMQRADDWLRWLQRRVPWVPSPSEQVRVIPPSIYLLGAPG